MTYEHHVFISYRHYSGWPDWVTKHFVPPLELWLGEELGEDALIFVDTGLETGNAMVDRDRSVASKISSPNPLLLETVFLERMVPTGIRDDARA